MDVLLTSYSEYLNVSGVTHAFDEIPMMSMTSFRWTEPFSLQALDTFNIWLVYLYIIFYVGLNCLVAAISWSDFCREYVGGSLTRLLLQQPTLFRSKHKTFKFVVNFLILSTLFKFLISDLFLTMVTFRSPDRVIETLQDLHDQPKVKILVLDKEPSHDVVSYEEHRGHFAKRVEVKKPDTVVNVTWEKSTFDRINRRQLVWLSDKPALDFMYMVYSEEFPNLYRSSLNKIVYPFVLPLFGTKYKQHFTSKAMAIFEAGLFRHWVSETLLLNRRGMCQVIQMERDNTFLFDEEKVTYQPLSMEDLAILIRFLIFFWLTAFLVLLGEILTLCWTANFNDIIVTYLRRRF